MAFSTSKANLRQSAVKAASELTAALIGANALDLAVGESTEDAARRVFDEFVESVYNDLVLLHESEPAPAPVVKGNFGGPRKSYSGGGNKTFDPGTLELKGGKYAGKTIADVYKVDKGWVERCAEGKFGTEFVQQRCKAYLEAKGAGVSQDPEYLAEG